MEIITSTHTLFLLYGLSVPHLTDFRRWGVRPPCGETTVYLVPIYGQQPCTLASISLCSLIAHAFRSPPLHRLSPAFPFLTNRAVNADKRYPLPRLLPSVSESKNSVNTFVCWCKDRELIAKFQIFRWLFAIFVHETAKTTSRGQINAILFGDIRNLL